MIHSIVSDKKANSVCTSKFVCLIGILSFILAVCFGIVISAKYAQAQDVTGWELNVGTGYNGTWDNEWAHNSYPAHFDHGIAVMASAGYRFTNWFSLNLEQTVAWEESRTDIDHYEVDYGGDQSYESATISETAATVKFIYLNNAKNFEMYFKLGLGALIQVGHNSHENGCDKATLIWYLPIGVGMNLFFTDKLGLGFDTEWDSATLILDGKFKTTAHLAVRF